jgi:DNA polymerase-3 subunit beta
VKVTCNPAALQSAVQVGRRIIGRSPLPILGCVLLTADVDGGLTVEADNLEARYRRSILAGVDEPGAIALHADALAIALGAFDGETIALETESAIIRVARLAGGNAQRHITRLTADGTTLIVRGESDDFPAARTFETDGEPCSIEVHALRRLLESVATSVAPDDARPVLAGVNLEAAGGNLVAAAADGFRLARLSAPLSAPAEWEALVPGALLLKAVRSLSKAATVDIRLLGGDDAISLSDGLSSWTLRRIAGQFPDFDRIIPKSAATVATCRTRDLRRAVSVARAIGKLGGTGYVTRLVVAGGRIVAGPTVREAKPTAGDGWSPGFLEQLYG